MSQASLIINVSNQPQLHSNGLSGTWIVPGKREKEDFSLLVVYPTPEIQDIGEGRKVVHWLKARPLAADIVGLRSDAAAHSHGSTGTKEKWGLLLCEAEPDLPKELIAAIEAEGEYLNMNMPDVKYKRDPETKATVAVNVEDDEVYDKKQELSDRVVELRGTFELECRRLVTKVEVAKAKRNLQTEDQRLVAEADRMWASNRPADRESINEIHQGACTRLGQERPWCYIPQQLVDCPGCGTKIKENILQCPSCHGWLDEPIEVLRRLPPRERSMKMYPERYEAETIPAGGKVK